MQSEENLDICALLGAEHMAKMQTTMLITEPLCCFYTNGRVNMVFSLWSKANVYYCNIWKKALIKMCYFSKEGSKFVKMKIYLLSIASMFAMYINVTLSKVLSLPTCEVSPTSDQIVEIRGIFNTIRLSIVSIVYKSLQDLLCTVLMAKILFPWQ